MNDWNRVQGKNEEEESQNQTHREANPKTPHLILLETTFASKASLQEPGLPCPSAEECPSLRLHSQENLLVPGAAIASAGMLASPVVRDETDVPGA
ncbi:hypothetical protein E2542_SST11061 [Spatholobus suberectus]|nr:hypothetical protein E2542_SST11061 [Spatholobus suberectus]